jgi:hypothetical protein
MPARNEASRRRAEKHMGHASISKGSEAGSPPRKGTPTEQTDEAPGLVESEQVEVERGIPADENQPIEGGGPRERPDPPVFEE